MIISNDREVVNMNNFKTQQQQQQKETLWNTGVLISP
jgi:hypothetical protein